MLLLRFEFHVSILDQPIIIYFHSGPVGWNFGAKSWRDRKVCESHRQVERLASFGYIFLLLWLLAWRFFCKFHWFHSCLRPYLEGSRIKDVSVKVQPWKKTSWKGWTNKESKRRWIQWVSRLLPWRSLDLLTYVSCIICIYLYHINTSDFSSFDLYICKLILIHSKIARSKCQHNQLDLLLLVQTTWWVASTSQHDVPPGIFTLHKIHPTAQLN